MKTRLFLAFALATPAHAATLVVDLRDTAGKPLADAVVTVHAVGRPTPRATSFAWGSEVVQRNIQFQPAVLIVPAGASVSFPNHDAVRHHVYSFSTPKKFDLKLYGRQTARAVLFDKTGTVALGCNIHDRMQGFLRVVDTAWANRSDAAGRLTIEGITPGPVAMTVWHAGARAKNQEARFEVVVPATGAISRTVTIPQRAR